MSVGVESAGTWRTLHRQVRVAWRDREADVDEGLAPLILALWKLDVDTLMSCQENRPGVAWLCFPTAYDAETFLNAVAVHPEEQADGGQEEVAGTPLWATLYGRAAGYGSDGDWEYAVHPTNYGVIEEVENDELIETCIGPSDFGFSVSVRMPVADLPEVRERVERAAALKGG